MKIVQYALRHIKSGKLLGFSVSSNDNGDFCNDTEVSLDEFNKNIWYTSTPEQAAYVRQFSTPWYNADMDTPNHDYEPGDLEVIKIIRDETHTKINVDIPTFEQLVELKYRKTEPGHADYLLSECKHHSDKIYSWYDLKEILSGGK